MEATASCRAVARSLIIHTQDPNSIHIGGAVEIFSRQAVQDAFLYTIPVGTNSYGGSDSATEPFKYVDVDLVAFDNNTAVTINNGLTIVTFTLNRGQHYSSRGYIDIPAVAGTPNAPVIAIRSGTTISTSGPLAATLFTGGDGNYANRFYALQPDRLHSTDYLTAAPGDNPAAGPDNIDRPLNIYVFNPDPLNPIAVTATDCRGQVTINVPANSGNNFFTASLTAPGGQRMPGYDPGPPARVCTVRLTSNRNFWGITAYDFRGSVGVGGNFGSASDWGDSLLATGFLSNAYTVPYSPGGTGVVNYNPVFVAPTVDNTYIQVDLNNDGVYDQVDTDGDGVANAFGDAASRSYIANALQSLRIFDQTDRDNSGTSIIASAPVAVSYGQDTDVTPAAGGIDTGFTVISSDQRFLDPVLTLAKDVSPSFVPTTGGEVTYTLRVNSYSFGPLTSLTVSDLLPSGVANTDYVAGSTLITFPDFTQSSANPTPAFEGAPTNRWRLTWNLAPKNTIDRNQTLTITYRVRIPAGTAARLQNNARADAQLNGSRFIPTAWANVSRTDIRLTKSASDDGSPEQGDTLTYSVTLQNAGAANETNVYVTDPIPAGTTFAGSITNGGSPLTGAYSAAQNAVVWGPATLPAGAGGGPFTLTFQVRIDPAVATGSVIQNEAIYRSTQTPQLVSEPAETIVVGPQIEATKSSTPAVTVHPTEIITFEIQASNTGSGAATNFTIKDPLPTNASYVAGSMSWSLNGGDYVTLTDGAADDQGTLFAGNRLEFVLASLGGGQDVRFRFRAQVTGAAGAEVRNQATLSATQILTRGTNLVRLPIVGVNAVNGHIFLDANANGIEDAGDMTIPNVDVVIAESGGGTQSVTTNAGGNYTSTFPVPAGSTTFTVDRTDPDFPAGATLCVGTDPQTVNVNANPFVVPSVGFCLPSISMIKSSSGGGLVVPGQTITYTLGVTNNGFHQSNVTLSDPLPAGTQYATGINAQIQLNTIRAREYQLDFNTSTTTLTLDGPLSPNYFVIVQGADGNGTDTDTNPNANYVSLTNDPFGTGDFVGGLAANQIALTRQANSLGWHGVVTVVECVGTGTACDTQGFRLRAVQRVPHVDATVAGTLASAYQWASSAANSRIMLLGGFNGPGCDTGETANEDHKVCHARIWPTGNGPTSTINWTRDAGGANSLTTATSTVMVLEWGSEWTVQRATIANGDAGGDGIDAAGEYSPGANNLATAVARANTWVWGTGHTDENGEGEAAEAVAITLGNGVATNATESRVSVGIEVDKKAMNFEVYALTHPSLHVSHTKKGDGDQDAPTYDLGVTSSTTVGQRMALAFNSCDGGRGTSYPRPMFSARYNGLTAIRMARQRVKAAFAAWVQGIDFADFFYTRFNRPPTQDLVALADGVTLALGERMIATYQVTVNDNPPPSNNEIVNTGTLTTSLFPLGVTATATDLLLRVGVRVEPNNAGFTLPNTVVVYNHDVTNTGSQTDSFRLTLTGELGWILELVDPLTGGLIARNSDGVGGWDGGVTVNTGTLASGASQRYQVRVTVPLAAPAGTIQTARLTATSNRSGSYGDEATDETTVLSAVGTVDLLPDNSGVVVAGGSIVYTHWVVNHTLAADTFDLEAISMLGWTVTYYGDTNGDGVYSTGDLPITNTAQLAVGASQKVFVSVTAPVGATANTVDIAHLTAISRANPRVFDGASDTTTILGLGRFDLSGGGTRMVSPDPALPAEVASFQGTILNLGTAADSYDLAISESSLNGVDGLLHPTELWIDADGNGTFETRIATDADGNGIWDPGSVDPAYRSPTGQPRVPVPAGGTIAYQLRRAVPPTMRVNREWVSLTSTSVANGEQDNVTSTIVLAAVTRATVRGLRVDRNGTIELATGSQRRTFSFDFFATDDARGETGRRLLNERPVLAPVPDSFTPILYRVETGPIPERYLVIVETETSGQPRTMGPFEVGDARLARSVDRVAARLTRLGVPEQSIRQAPRWGVEWGERQRRLRGARQRDFQDRAQREAASDRLRRRAISGVKVMAARRGSMAVSLSQLRGAGLDVADASGVTVTNRGRNVPVRVDRVGTEDWLRFRVEGLTTDYADENAYVLLPRGSAPPVSVPLTTTGGAPAPGATRVTNGLFWVMDARPGWDPWVWDVLASDAGPWPYVDWCPEAGRFALPDLAPGLTADVPVRLTLLGYTAHQHTVEARINGQLVGSLTFDGIAEAVLSGTVPGSLLQTEGNELTLEYSAQPLDEATTGAGTLLLSHMDLDARLAPPALTADRIVPYRPELPSFRGAQYLIVTHERFREAADRLAAAKRSEGLRTVVVDTELAYDAFSGGVVEAQAIRALIRHAAARSRSLKYVVLVGDDTIDPHDYSGMGATSFVPSLIAYGRNSMRLPSENLYADVDDDGRPDLAIGRLPVQTAEQANLVVDKIEAQTELLAPSATRHLFVVDNANDGDAPFAAEAGEMAQKVKAARVWADLRQGAPLARRALESSWRQGAALTSYFGHGGPEIWADEQVLTIDDVNRLGTSIKPTVLLDWACESQWFQYLWGATVNEALLMVPGGGSVASFGPVGISPPAAQRDVYESVYGRLGSGATLGEIIRQAKREAMDRNGGAKDAVEGFVLLGDPALRLPPLLPPLE